ncbi:BrnA antitoxin family protein [Rhodocista pekingensis]|uniref:BrnA antitoxin family protein n=1 Tax=Rhodocista pekingensis TaxID=201185 RepID=A0ABW2KR78_9PROT
MKKNRADAAPAVPAADLPDQLRDQLRALAALRDEEIDLTEMPEVRDWSQARRGPPSLYRPVKEVVTIRLDADVLHWFRDHAAGGRGYQTRINAALRAYMDQHRND